MNCHNRDSNILIQHMLSFAKASGPLGWFQCVKVLAFWNERCELKQSFGFHCRVPW